MTIKEFLVNIDADIAEGLEKNDMDNMYNHNIQVSYMGKSCCIPFGANEWFIIKAALEEIMEEQ